MVDISDEELFANALGDQEPEAQVQETEPQATEQQTDERPRDEQGRFAAKQAEPEPKPEAQAESKPEQKEEAQIPSWRLREIREERDALQRQVLEMQRALTQPKPQQEQPKKPDLFEDPNGFLKSGLTEALAPVQQQIASFIENFSRDRAFERYGEEKVSEAYSALDRQAKAGDQQAVAAVQAIKQSTDPYGQIVQWHQRNVVASNPEAFFQQRLAEALKDEKFKGELLSKLQPAQQEKPKSTFVVPPSLGRAASAAAALEESGDLSNESLFANALR